MKIVLFEGGNVGVVKTLPGEYPMEEIGELLGGAVEWPPQKLTPALGLCKLERQTDKKVKYAYLRQWRGLAETEGACAVVHMAADGTLRDVTNDDVKVANELVWPVEDKEETR